MKPNKKCIQRPSSAFNVATRKLGKRLFFIIVSEGSGPPQPFREIGGKEMKGKNNHNFHSSPLLCMAFSSPLVLFLWVFQDAAGASEEHPEPPSPPAPELHESSSQREIKEWKKICSRPLRKQALTSPHNPFPPLRHYQGKEELPCATNNACVRAAWTSWRVCPESFTNVKEIKLSCKVGNNLLGAD